jgi:hypothetical protein
LEFVRDENADPAQFDDHIKINSDNSLYGGQDEVGAFWIIVIATYDEFLFSSNSLLPVS